MGIIEFSRYIVTTEGDKIFETYSKTQLLDFMDSIKNKGYKDLMVYQSLKKKEGLSILERIGMTKGQFMTSARQKFGGENVIMVDGDLFYIKSCNGDWFAGKKILKDLTLSAEDFKINL